MPVGQGHRHHGAGNSQVKVRGANGGKAMPKCQFGASCTRKGCWYTHPPRDKKIKSAELHRPRKGEVCMPFLTPAGCGGGGGCSRVHPRSPLEQQAWRLRLGGVACRNGEGCATQHCLYKHPGTRDAARRADAALTPIEMQRLAMQQQQAARAQAMQQAQQAQQRQHAEVLSQQVSTAAAPLFVPDADYDAAAASRGGVGAEERRIDEADSNPYTYAEFLSEYGEYAQQRWQASVPEHLYRAQIARARAARAAAGAPELGVRGDRGAEAALRGLQQHGQLGGGDSVNVRAAASSYGAGVASVEVGGGAGFESSALAKWQEVEPAEVVLVARSVMVDSETDLDAQFEGGMSLDGAWAAQDEAAAAAATGGGAGAWGTAAASQPAMATVVTDVDGAALDPDFPSLADAPAPPAAAAATGGAAAGAGTTAPAPAPATSGGWAAMAVKEADPLKVVEQERELARRRRAAAMRRGEDVDDNGGVGGEAGRLYKPSGRVMDLASAEGRGYFCNDLVHPTQVFTAYMVAYPDQEGMVAALQYGQTMNGTPYVSFRGAPIKGLAELLLPALARLQRRTAETKIVVVTGVGGTDFRNKQHKHASHTKGGTVDEAIGIALNELSGDSARSGSHQILAGVPTALYTKQEGGGLREERGRKLFGSWLVRLAPSGR